MTKSEFISQISQDLLTDPSNRIWTTTNVLRELNRSYSTLQSDMRWFLPSQEKTTTVTLIAGTQEYSLPSNYQSTISLSWDYPLKQIQKEDVITATGTPTSYYIYAWSLWVYPTPTQAQTLTLLYEASQPDIADWQDSTTPTICDMAIKYLTASSLLKQKAKFDMAQIFEWEYYKEINRCKVSLFDSKAIELYPDEQKTLMQSIY